VVSRIAKIVSSNLPGRIVFWKGIGEDMILDRCLEVKDLKTPTLTINKCPNYGEEIEIFSNDTHFV